MFRVDDTPSSTNRLQQSGCENSSLLSSLPSGLRVTPMITRLQNLRLSSTPRPPLGTQHLNSSGIKKQLDFGNVFKSSFKILPIIAEEANEEDSEVVLQPPKQERGYTPQE